MQHLNKFCVVVVQEYPMESLELLSGALGWGISKQDVEEETEGVIYMGNRQNMGKVTAMLLVLKKTRNIVALQLREALPLDHYLYE